MSSTRFKRVHKVERFKRSHKVEKLRRIHKTQKFRAGSGMNKTAEEYAVRLDAFRDELEKIAVAKIPSSGLKGLSSTTADKFKAWFRSLSPQNQAVVGSALISSGASAVLSGASAPKGYRRENALKGAVGGAVGGAALGYGMHKLRV